jgi:hypothetical protein
MVLAQVPHVVTRACECCINALCIGSPYSISLGVAPCAVDRTASVLFYVETSVAKSARDKKEGKRKEIE